MQKKGFGVIGVGVMGQTHIKAYLSHPFAELVAISDINKERAKEVAQKYGIKRYYQNYRELLKLDEIQGVSIVTPDFAHTEITLAALDAGKDVLLEKPMATTIEECAKIHKKVQEVKVKFMLDFHNRWNPPFVEAKKVVEKGEIGEIEYIYCRLNDTIFVPTKMISWAGKSTVNWFLASHCLDILMWLFEDEVDSVYSVSKSKVLREKGIDTPDLFTSILKFKRGGIANLENGWILPETAPNVFDFKVEIIGTQGALYIDTSHHRIMQKYTPQEANYPELLGNLVVHKKAIGFAVESIYHFIDCVVFDKEPLVGAEEGEKVTRVIAAIQESAKDSKVIKVKDIQ